MIKKALIVFVIAVVISLVFACGAPSDETEVPVNLENAKNVGSLQMNISYDASVLEAMEVNAEELGEKAMVEFDISQSGVATIGVIDSSGISGSGPIISVSFNILDQSATSPLRIENVQAHDVNTLIDLPFDIQQGRFSDGQVTAPSLDFQ